MQSLSPVKYYFNDHSGFITCALSWISIIICIFNCLRRQPHSFIHPPPPFDFDHQFPWYWPVPLRITILLWARADSFIIFFFLWRWIIPGETLGNGSSVISIPLHGLQVIRECHPGKTLWIDKTKTPTVSLSRVVSYLATAIYTLRTRICG